MADKLLSPSEKTQGKPDGVKNFSYAEMEFYDRIPPELIQNADILLKNLQVLRDVCGKPITIMSGYRSFLRNQKISGAAKSIHQTGGAADIKVKGMKPEDVASLIEKLVKEGRMTEGGIGIYPRATPEEGWTHYDSRTAIKVEGFPTARARWNG